MRSSFTALCLAGLLCASSQAAAQHDGHPAPEQEAGCAFDQDCPPGTLCDARECIPVDGDQPPPTIIFEFDSGSLSQAQAEVVTRFARVLRAWPDRRVRVEGHMAEIDCVDASGSPISCSDEYALALGERRAQTVKRLLVDLGIEASRIETISYGEGRPLCRESTETCWARNRRAELVFIE